MTPGSTPTPGFHSARPSPGTAPAWRRRAAPGIVADLAVPFARWAACLLAMLGVLHALGLADLAPHAR